LDEARLARVTDWNGAAYLTPRSEAKFACVHCVACAQALDARDFKRGKTTWEQKIALLLPCVTPLRVPVSQKLGDVSKVVVAYNETVSL
jgi:hypothetical protein